MLYSAPHGWYFIYHMIVLYIVLLSGILYLGIFFLRHPKVHHYRSISIFIIIGVLVALALNLIQFYIHDIPLDLTYVALIIGSFGLYEIIFNLDMVYNLKVSGRSEILSNMREIYILTDKDKIVIDISPLLVNKYHLNKEKYIGESFELLRDDLEEIIVLYTDYDVDEGEYIDKDHYHIREKKFVQKGFRHHGYMILLYDETQVYKLLQELNHLSYYDYMTGLHNRNYMETKLEQLKDIKNIGVLSLDLNGLKANNDYLGHERGDYLLKTLAKHMVSVLKEYPDHDVARIGGDEFLILLYDAKQMSLSYIKDSILRLCDHADIEKKISVSIGIAYQDNHQTIFELIKDADVDMYKMKQNLTKAYSEEIVKYAKKTGKYIR